MGLLLDANLSWRLMERLKEHFTDCWHVDHIGLVVPATDIEIWNYAKENNLVIVTNDDDFLNLLSAKGFPPKVFLLRTGNQSTKFIADLLIKHKVSLLQLDDAEDYGLLEVF